MAFAPTPKVPGDLIKSADWNEALAEIVRLETAKLNRTGGALTGPLTVDGALGVGATNPDRALTVQGAGSTYLNVKANNGAQEVLLGADAGSGGVVSTMTNHDLQLRAGSNVTRMIIKADGKIGVGTTTPAYALDVADRMRVRQGAAGTAGIWFFQSTPNADRAFVGMASDDSLGLYGNTGAGFGLQMNTSNGNVSLSGNLSIPKTAGGSAVFMNGTFDNENTFQANNLKLSMGHIGFIIGGQPLTYEFAVGHTFSSFAGGGFSTSFVKRFSVNHLGNVFMAGALTAGGGKGGYVFDDFVNAVGDTLEQGDVVVLGTRKVSLYYGADNKIPIPEVDLTTQAYDTRACGIVDTVVQSDQLPPVEVKQLTQEEAEALAKRSRRRRKTAASSMDNPLASRAAQASPDLDPTKVEPDQLGKMVTLGAYAYCKVDADIAPIKVGDLLTTSPTRGHAQKVLETEKAVGAIIGKALGSLKKGKGKIPVLVLLQ